jgi:hypothetical protein
LGFATPIKIRLLTQIQKLRPSHKAWDNASRVIKYVVALGYRADSYNLVDLRIHDINVVADPNKRLPSVPDPVGSDGTSEGLYEGSIHDLPIPTLEDILSDVVQWWTGWWPELHTRFEQTTSDGQSIIYQEKCDLLGHSVVEATSLHASNVDPIEEQSFYEALAENVIDAWAATLATKIIALLLGTAASIACIFCVAPVNPGLLLLAAGLVAAYTGTLIVDLVLTIEKAITMTDNALMRWWIIVASMSLVILGWACYGILIPYAGFYSNALRLGLSTNFVDWTCSLTEPSVVFLVWKVCLIGLIFAVATSVFIWTILGWL